MNDRWTEYLMSKHGVAWFKCDEVSGNILDSKGDFIGTPYNITRVDDEKGGKALNFNGTNSYVQFNQKVIPVGKKSIYFRIKVNNNSKAMVIMDTCDHNQNQNGIQILLLDMGVLFFRIFGDKTWDNAVAGKIIINDGIWHDIIFTYDGDKIISYVDGVLDINTSLSIVEPLSYTNNLRLGRYVGTATDVTHFNGQLDNIQIYNDVINPMLPNKYLIQDNDKIKKTTMEGLEKIGIAPATVEMFELYGTDYLPDIIGEYDREVDMVYKGNLEDMKLFGYKLVGYKDIRSLGVK